MKLTATALEELSATSAYKAFEQHCCILQKVEPRGMSINERVLFWVNIYNTITGTSIVCEVVLRVSGIYVVMMVIGNAGATGTTWNHASVAKCTCRLQHILVFRFFC